VYSSVVRLFGWQTALEVFRHHPLFGVGYLGFRFVAHDYNALGMYFSTVENFFLETAVGMGILGLLVLSLFAIACWRLGRAARRHAEPGSQAHRLGEMTPAFLLSVFVANLTSDNLIGLVNGGQLAIFFALLAQASLLPACRRAGSGRP
jgi:O-antigen ligase